jgi:hypothetical protein
METIKIISNGDAHILKREKKVFDELISRLEITRKSKGEFKIG